MAEKIKKKQMKLLKCYFNVIIKTYFLFFITRIFKIDILLLIRNKKNFFIRESISNLRQKQTFKFTFLSKYNSFKKNCC